MYATGVEDDDETGPNGTQHVVWALVEDGRCW